MSRDLLALLLAVAVAGCSGGARPAGRTGSAPAGNANPTHAQLLARADLDPCPPSSPRPAAHALPALTLACLGAGPAVHLAGLTGTPAVVNVWGSWCTPCQREIPYFTAVYAEAHGAVRFLGVDTEDQPDSALDFAAHVRPPMHYPSVLDPDKKVLIGLRLPSAVPTTVFVGADGQVRHVVPGAYRSAAALRADIRRYLGVSA